MKNQEPGARSREPGAGSQEPGVRNQEPEGRGQEPEGRGQEPEGRGQKSEVRRQKYLLSVMFVCLLSSLLCSLVALGSEKWQGVDETVVGKFAAEQGRAAHKPLINSDQGDLLLFAFLIAGTVAGFAAGYYWRTLVTEKSPAAGGKKQKDMQEGRE